MKKASHQNLTPFHRVAVYLRNFLFYSDVFPTLAAATDQNPNSGIKVVLGDEV